MKLFDRSQPVRNVSAVAMAENKRRDGGIGGDKPTIKQYAILGFETDVIIGQADSGRRRFDGGSRVKDHSFLHSEDNDKDDKINDDNDTEYDPKHAVHGFPLYSRFENNVNYHSIRNCGSKRQEIVLIDRGRRTLYFDLMKQPLVLLCLLALFATGAGGQAGKTAATQKAAPKYICITLDDLPVSRVQDRFERLVVTDKLIGALAEFNVSAAGFVIGDHIGSDIDLLEQWLKAGHTLGSQTYSQPDLNDVPVELFIQDIGRGTEAIEDVLASTKQKKRYFRYPLLHLGDNFTKKKAVTDYLTAHNLVVVPATVSTDEYVYNLQYEKLSESGDTSKIHQLGLEYIDNVLGQIEAAEKLALKITGKSIKHILLLHANRLNGHFLGDLLASIQELGYSFVSLDKALTDPVYKLPDGYVGYKGLTFLERLQNSDPDFLPASEGK